MGGNQHLLLASHLITAHKHNAEGFIASNSPFCVIRRSRCFTAIVTATNTEVICCNATRAHYRQLLAYHTCCCHAWGGGVVFSGRGRKAKLIICSTALEGNNRGTLAPTLEQWIRNHTNLKWWSSYNRKVKKKRKKKNCYQEMVLGQRRSRGWQP